MQNARPKWFIPIIILALLWNLIGAAAIVHNFTLTAQDILLLPIDQQSFMNSIPIWSKIASVIAVSFGCLGCVLLLIKRKLANVVFIISFVAILVQNFALFIYLNGLEVNGIVPVIMQCVVMAIAYGLIFLSSLSIRRQWVH